MSRRSDEETIQELLDGRLDARAFEAFEARLRVEPDLRTLFLSYSRSHHVLEEKFAQSEPRAVVNSGPRRRRAWPVLAIAACAALLTTATILLKRPAPRASLVFGPESHGRVVHQHGGGEDALLLPGSLVELDHGSASIELAGGGYVYFEGPGVLEYDGDGDFRLQLGRAWFQSTAGSDTLRCSTSDLEVHGSESGFGLIAGHGHRQELHVVSGRVTLNSSGDAATELAAGQSAFWSGANLTTRSGSGQFATHFPRPEVIFHENFDEPDLTPLAGKSPDVGCGPWKIDWGGPVIESRTLDTSGNVRHAAFAPLAGAQLDELSHILLLTLITEEPDTAQFHSPGWAGVSLYTGNEERIFVGDPNGPEMGWALHPVGYEARHACPLLEGRNTVTLRYDFRSGLAQLFAGTDTSGPALASEWISAGLTFDRIRIANGSQADAAVDAGKDPSAAGQAEDVNIRGDIALREIKVSVLSAVDPISSTQP